MSLNFPEPREIQSQFERMTKEITRVRLHCHFMTFGATGPTWEKRLELRSLLVKDLENSFENFPEDYKKKLLTPGSSPHLPGVSISISHCPLFGGFVFSSDKGLSLGLDIEEADRVSLRSVKYVSSLEEIGESPEVSFLWVAKEAAFKSVPSEGQQYFLRDLLISDWWKTEMEGYGFGFFLKKKNIKGKGIIFRNDHLVFGFAFQRTPGLWGKTSPEYQ